MFVKKVMKKDNSLPDRTKQNENREWYDEQFFHLMQRYE